MATMNPKRISKLKGLRDFFINAQGGANSFDPNNEANPLRKQFEGQELGKEQLAALLKRQNLYDSATNEAGPTLGETAKLGMGAASAHPLQTGAGALTTGMNLAGLTDNDKFGGQIGGLALGGLASYGLGLNPGYAYLATTAGGALGSLFDKLRAKREAEAQQAQMYQQAYR